MLIYRPPAGLGDSQAQGVAGVPAAVELDGLHLLVISLGRQEAFVDLADVPFGHVPRGHGQFARAVHPALTLRDHRAHGPEGGAGVARRIRRFDPLGVVVHRPVHM